MHHRISWSRLDSVLLLAFLGALAYLGYRIEVGQRDDRIAEVLESLAREFLDRHVAHEMIDAKSAVGRGKAIRWEDMVRPAAVVANGFGRPLSKKDRARAAQR